MGHSSLFGLGEVSEGFGVVKKGVCGGVRSVVGRLLGLFYCPAGRRVTRIELEGGK